MGVAAGDRAVSIPQITYDHIQDSQEKRDASYCLVQEEQAANVEGEAAAPPQSSSEISSF